MSFVRILCMSALSFDTLPPQWDSRNVAHIRRSHMPMLVIAAAGHFLINTGDHLC